MSEPTEHTYAPTMLVDRLAEIRTLLQDERSRVEQVSVEQQRRAAECVSDAISALGIQSSQRE